MFRYANTLPRQCRHRVNRDNYAGPACFRSYSKSGAIADMVLPTLCAMSGCEQMQHYSITSSAMARSEGGTLRRSI